MRIQKVLVERFSVTSSNPFEFVVAALEAAVGRQSLLEFAKSDLGSANPRWIGARS